jgi:hypothetical protein
VAPLLASHTFELLRGLFALRRFLTAMNSPPFLSRLVKAVAPPIFVLSCVRFFTAPLRALSQPVY